MTWLGADWCQGKVSLAVETADVAIAQLDKLRVPGS